MFRPLAGVKVLDLSHLLAGPYCSYLLSMMGAEVIKVEPPEGDWTRRQGSDQDLNDARMGLTFLAQNAGKRSVTVNLKHHRGAGVVMRLARGSHVFLENMRPGVIGRLGLGYEALRQGNPSLVYCSLSGFGQNGPLSHRPAYDHVIEGMSGLMSINGHPQDDPVKVAAPIIDYASGMSAALAIVSSLHESRRSGRGCHLDVAMLDTMLNLLSAHVVEFVNAGRVPRRIGNDAPSGVATAGAFESADGPILIAANAEAHFAPLVEALGMPQLKDDPRFATAPSRQSNREALRSLLSDAISRRTAAEWEAILDSAGVPAARPRTIPEVIGDPHVRLRGVVQDIEGRPGGGRLGLTSLGWHANGRATGPHGAPPALGADTEAVLQEAGYSKAEISELRDSGAL